MINGIENINIQEVIGQYVELQRSGKWLIGLCPFHDEKTPSFFVYPKRFKCFGCGRGGDVFDFIQKFKGLDFKGALKDLGVSNGKLTKEEKKNIQKQKQRQKAIAKFRDWEDRYSDEVGIMLLGCNMCLDKIKTPDEMEKYASIFHAIPILEYHLDILISRDDALKGQLRRSVGDNIERIIREPNYPDGWGVNWGVKNLDE